MENTESTKNKTQQRENQKYSSYCHLLNDSFVLYLIHSSGYQVSKDYDSLGKIGKKVAYCGARQCLCCNRCENPSVEVQGEVRIGM